MEEYKLHKGKFLFIPEGENETAYEVDADSLVKDPTWWDKLKNFFSNKESDTLQIKMTPIEIQALDVNTLVCTQLEELLSGASWHFKGEEHVGPPCFIVGVVPQEHETGWEPKITVALSNGTAAQMGLADLLIHYEPEVGGGQLVHPLFNN